MKNLITPENEACPFAFNFDALTFKVGDRVSYRIPGIFDDFPFVGSIVEVNENHIMIAPNEGSPQRGTMRGTRENRPVVNSADLRF